jgi:TetR/AcrR family transcriptional regulator, repressor for uid operon
MNVHSQLRFAWETRVGTAEIQSIDTLAGRDGDRRAHILAAAERAFLHEGFHATSMQNVAAEARMSPGNLYRYFPSKEAIVAGLCARDQEMLAANVGMLVAGGDPLSGIERLLRRHLVDEPRERFQMIVEIWAEATRKPEIAALCLGIDAHVRRGLAQVVESAKRLGVAPPDVDTDFVVRIMVTIVIGLFKRRAHESEFNGNAELALALAVINAAIRGRVRPVLPI